MPVSQFLVTTLPGLEPVVESEIVRKLGQVRIADKRRGRIFLESETAGTHIFSLRSIDNVYLHLGRFPVGPHRTHLAALTTTVARLDLSPVAGALERIPGPGTTFWVNASRSGRHTYSRFEAATAAAHGVRLAQSRWGLGTERQHDLEFRLDIEDDLAWLSLRLTPPAFRFRGDLRRFSQAALRPTVAHALVWLSDPSPDEVFLDPFCGSGTILSERLPYPAQRIIGSDLDAQTLEVARHNLPVDPRLMLASWDARDLPLDPRSVEKIVTNLPFGRQILDASDIPTLYLSFLRQVQRLLTPGGQAIVLTDQLEVLFGAVDRTRLHAQEVLAVSLKGLHPRILRLTAP
jgi:tRNA (guanine6-N2)-methyltransferase